MKYFFKISTLFLLLILSGCATRASHPKNVSNVNEIAALKKIEIFYNSQAYAVIVQSGGGLLALASIGEADRIAARSEALTAAMGKSFPDQDLNLQFAQALADKLQERGVEVKITRIERPVGDIDIRKTRQYIDAPKTPGYATLVLRATTRYIAPSFAQGFKSAVQVSYVLVDPQQDRTLIRTTDVETGSGETYATFDNLLSSHAAAHEQSRVDLLSLVPRIYTKLTQ